MGIERVKAWRYKCKCGAIFGDQDGDFLFYTKFDLLNTLSSYWEEWKEVREAHWLCPECQKKGDKDGN